MKKTSSWLVIGKSGSIAGLDETIKEDEVLRIGIGRCREAQFAECRGGARMKSEMALTERGNEQGELMKVRGVAVKGLGKGEALSLIGALEEPLKISIHGISEIPRIGA